MAVVDLHQRLEEYADRIFTTRFTAVPGGTQLDGKDFSPVIEKAKACPPCEEAIEGSSTVGYHRTVLLDAAETIVQAVKDGQISRFFVIGGCDGAEPGRNYFSDYAQATPPDSFILTLGCGKFRIREHEYGTHLGLPRLLDMGQCNDAYGAIAVASALAEAFDCKGMRVERASDLCRQVEIALGDRLQGQGQGRAVRSGHGRGQHHRKGK